MNNNKCLDPKTHAFDVFDAIVKKKQKEIDATKNKQKTTTESNIRRKAHRRGFTVSKYRKGYVDVYSIREWCTPTVEMYNGTLEEIETFLATEPTLKQQE